MSCSMIFPLGDRAPTGVWPGTGQGRQRIGEVVPPIAQVGPGAPPNRGARKRTGVRVHPAQNERIQSRAPRTLNGGGAEGGHEPPRQQGMGWSLPCKALRVSAQNNGEGRRTAISRLASRLLYNECHAAGKQRRRIRKEHLDAGANVSHAYRIRILEVLSSSIGHRVWRRAELEYFVQLIAEYSWPLGTRSGEERTSRIQTMEMDI